MTIEEIKEWRRHTLQVYGIHTDTLDVIDTLLAEVERLEMQASIHKDEANRMIESLFNMEVKRTTATSQLAVATEALEKIKERREDKFYNKELAFDFIWDIARTALERMKG